MDVMEFLHRGMFCLLLDLIGWMCGSVYPSTEVCCKADKIVGNLATRILDNCKRIDHKHKKL